MKRVTARLAAVALLFPPLLVSCASFESFRIGEDRSSTTPRQPIAVLVMSPSQATFIPTKDEVVATLFDAGGEIVATARGRGIENGRAEIGAAAGSSVFTAGDQLTSIPSGERLPGSEFNGTEAYVQTSASSPTGRQSIFWFNTGFKEDGTYENRYTASWTDGTIESGGVPGLVLASGFCPDGANYSIVEDSMSVEWGQRTTNWLYQTERNSPPQRIAAWTSPEGFRPVTSTAICDSGELRVLFGSDLTRNSKIAADRKLTQVAIDLRDPINQSKTEILLGNHSWRTPADTLTQTADSIYWVNSDGVVLQAPKRATSGAVVHAQQVWKLPVHDDREMRTVSVAKHDDEILVSMLDWTTKPAKYSVRRLVTGEVVQEQVSLPWLSDIVGEATPSGLARYTVSDIELLYAPRRK